MLKNQTTRHPFQRRVLDILERLLPQQDVLLIHPGVERQKNAFHYAQQFPHLRVALVIPGAFNHYRHEEIHDVPLWGYENVNEIVEFVLQRKSE